jgi:hypothetical protein
VLFPHRGIAALSLCISIYDQANPISKRGHQPDISLKTISTTLLTKISLITLANNNFNLIESISKTEQKKLLFANIKL